MRLLRRLEAVGSDIFDAIELDGRSCFRSSFNNAICGTVMVVSLSGVVDDINEVEEFVRVLMAASR